MSSSLSPLLSATFWEEGYDHLVEPVHQRDAHARRHLAALDVSVFDGTGKRLLDFAVDPRDEVVDVDALLAGSLAGRGRLLVLFDARYDERIFPYRPHHYGYLHRRGSPAPPLYYAVNSVLGGVPDRIGATGMNNFETYLFRRQQLPTRHGVLVANVSRFTAAEVQVTAFYGDGRVTERASLPPKLHAELPLPSERNGHRLERVEVKAPFRLATYVIGRQSTSDDLVLFDHLFTYFR
jgi:hypothetical protein